MKSLFCEVYEGHCCWRVNQEGGPESFHKFRFVLFASYGVTKSKLLTLKEKGPLGSPPSLLWENKNKIKSYSYIGLGRALFPASPSLPRIQPIQTPQLNIHIRQPPPRLKGPSKPSNHNHLQRINFPLPQVESESKRKNKGYLETKSSVFSITQNRNFFFSNRHGHFLTRALQSLLLLVFPRFRRYCSRGGRWRFTGIYLLFLCLRGLEAVDISRELDDLAQQIR